MRIGIDFDNTIVRYDDLFWTCAREQDLVGDEVPRTKRAVRDAIRLLPQGNERWTELQGLVYGHRILEADPAPGVVEFLERCRDLDVDVVIISHKTLTPAAGPAWNLHDAARAWLGRHIPGNRFGPGSTRVFLELTLAAKLERIRSAGCTHFIDDLEEVFTRPDFPSGVTRLLYEPEAHSADGSARALEGVAVCRRWDEMAQVLLAKGGISAGNDAPSRLDHVARLVPGDATVRCITPLQQGANSSVCSVETTDGAHYALKLYPLDSSGDVRMAREFSFLRFLWGHGIRQVPEPVARDTERRMALYGFVGGEKRAVEHLGLPEVEQACGFLASLQDLRAARGAEDLAPAAEACFSLAEHVRLVQRRVDALEEALVQVTEPPILVRNALAFLRARIRPMLGQVTTRMAEQAASLGLALGEELPATARILTPSDFGFHNILCDSAGKMAFVDFEYAGWDDPAKTLVDFFHQPERPVPPALWGTATKCLAEAARSQSSRHGSPSWFEGVEARSTLLYPLLGVKWCLIMLNVFRRLPPAAPGTPTVLPPEAGIRLLGAQEKLEDVRSTWRNGAPWTT